MSDEMRGQYIVDVKADLSTVEKQVQNLQRLIETLHPVIDFNINDNDLHDINALMKKLTDGLELLKKNTGINIDLNYSSVSKAIQELEKLTAVRQRLEKVKNTQNIFDEFKLGKSVINDGLQIIGIARKINKEINQLSKKEGLTAEQSFDNETRILSLKQALLDLEGVYKNAKVNKPFNTLFDADGLKRVSSYKTAIDDLERSVETLSKNESENLKIVQNFEKLGKAMSSFDTSFKQAAEILNQSMQSFGSAVELQPLLDKLEEIKSVINDIESKIDTAFDGTDNSGLSTLLGNITSISEELTELHQDFKKAFEIDSSDFSSIQSKISNVISEINDLGVKLNTMFDIDDAGLSSIATNLKEIAQTSLNPVATDLQNMEAILNRLSDPNVAKAFDNMQKVMRSGNSSKTNKPTKKQLLQDLGDLPLLISQVQRSFRKAHNGLDVKSVLSADDYKVYSDYVVEITNNVDLTKKKIDELIEIRSRYAQVYKMLSGEDFALSGPSLTEQVSNEATNISSAIQTINQATSSIVPVSPNDIVDTAEMAELKKLIQYIRDVINVINEKKTAYIDSGASLESVVGQELNSLITLEGKISELKQSLSNGLFDKINADSLNTVIRNINEQTLENIDIHINNELALDELNILSQRLVALFEDISTEHSLNFNANTALTELTTFSNKISSIIELLSKKYTLFLDTNQTSELSDIQLLHQAIDNIKNEASESLTLNISNKIALDILSEFSSRLHEVINELKEQHVFNINTINATDELNTFSTHLDKLIEELNRKHTLNIATDEDNLTSLTDSVQTTINKIKDDIDLNINDKNAIEKLQTFSNKFNEVVEYLKNNHVFKFNAKDAINDLKSFGQQLKTITDKLSKEYSLVLKTNVEQIAKDIKEKVNNDTEKNDTLNINDDDSDDVQHLNKETDAYNRAVDAIREYTGEQKSLWDITKHTTYSHDKEGNEVSSSFYQFRDQDGNSFVADEDFKVFKETNQLAKDATEYVKLQKDTYSQLNKVVKERLSLEKQLSNLNLDNKKDLEIGLEIAERLDLLKEKEENLRSSLLENGMTDTTKERDIDSLKEQSDFQKRLNRLTKESKQEDQDFVKKQKDLYSQLNKAQQELYKNKKAMANMPMSTEDENSTYNPQDQSLYDRYKQEANNTEKNIKRIKSQILDGGYSDAELDAALTLSKKRLENEVEIAKIKAKNKQVDKDNQKFANEQNNKYKDLKSIITDIYNISEDFNKVTGQTEADDQLRLNYQEQLIDALKEEARIRKEIRDNGYTNQDKENEITEYEESLILRNENSELKRQSKSQKQILDLRSKINNKLKDAQQLINEAKGNLSEYTGDIAKLEKELLNIKLDGLDSEGLQKAEKDIQNITKSLNDMKKSASQVEKIQLLVGDKDLSSKSAREEFLQTTAAAFKLENAIMECNAELTEMIIVGRNAAGQIQKIQLNLNDDYSILSGEISTRNKSMSSTVSSASSLIDSLSGIGNKLGSYIKYFGISEVVYGAWNQLQKGIGIMREFNSAMTELRKVTNLTEGEYANFADTAARVGNEVARTMTEVTSASADFSRLGYDIEEATALAKNALIMTNIGDGIALEDATSAIVSTLKGFEMEGSTSETIANSQKIVDSINNVSNNFALSTQDIAEAIQKMSAVFNQGGTTFDETIAMFTAGMEVMQDSSKVSHGLTTISQRIRGISDEGEDLSDLQPKLEAQFNKMGLTLLDTNGELKSTYDIFNELSTVWDHQSSQMQQYVGELMAGKNQISVLQSTLQNWSAAQEAVTASINSEGSALKENAAVLDSVEGKIQAFNAQLEVMWNNALKSDFVKNVIDFGTAIISLVDKIGLIPSVLTTVASVASLVNIDKNILSTTGVTPGIA